MNQFSINVDLFPFLIEAFSLNKKIYKKIDKLYNSEYHKFYTAAIKSKYYTHPISIQGNLEQDLYYRKALGILEIARNSEDVTNQVFNLMEYGWPYCHTYVINNNKILIQDFLCRFIKKNRGIENLSDDELNSNILMTIQLANMYNRKIDIDDEAYITYMHSLVARQNFCKNKNKINIDNENKHMRKRLRDIQSLLLKENKFLYQPLGKELPFEDTSTLNIFLNAIDFVPDTEDISLVTLVGNNYLSSKEVDELILCYLCLLQDDSQIENNMDDLKKFIYSASTIKHLCKAYKQAKKFILDTVEVNNANNVTTLYTQINQLESHIDKLEKENNELKKSQDNLLKQIKNLNCNHDKYTQNIEELHALRELMFENANNIIESSDDIKKVNLDSLNSTHNVIIGGSPSWQNKMKTFLPNWTYIDVNTLNFDKKLLNVGHIFINISYISHSLYYRVVENIHNETKLHYINNTNSDLCIQFINKELSNN